MNDALITVPSRFKRRVYSVLLLLILCYGFIQLMHWRLGHSIARGEHSELTQVHEIIIGNDVLHIPQNMMRLAKQRVNGVTKRVDLYAKWPDLSGYSNKNSDIFNMIDKTGKLLFISFERRVMVHDMSGRFEPIYKTFVKGVGTTQTNGLTRYELLETSGFKDEAIYVGYKPDSTLFVARCLNPKEGEQHITPCQKDSHVGKNTSMMVRFSFEMLNNWQELDTVLKSFVAKTLR